MQFAEAECARRALEQLHGFELAGRAMRVGQVAERPDGTTDVAFPEQPDGDDGGGGRVWGERGEEVSRRPSGLRKTSVNYNSLAHRTTWLRSDLLGPR